MAKTKDDWKAEAKKLKAKVKELRARLEAEVAPVVESAFALAADAVGDAAQAAASAVRRKTNPVSPLAPKGGFPALPRIDGVEFAAAAAGVRYAGRTDVTLIRLAPGTTIAGAFTTSATRAACILDCEAKLKKGDDTAAGAAIIVNSGNANAFTGRLGAEAVVAVTEGVAKVLGIPASRVFSSSTGVIGEPLPHDRITAKLEELAAGLSADGIELAARAIMTTDTFPKGAAEEIAGQGGPI
ncbi:MAG: bifunctional ornithine acetyltransferase/N-acetylglutamate synthase, partial [Albidovulum sp.]